MTKVQIQADNAALKSENKALKSELAELRRLIYGYKSERFVTPMSEEQLSLFENTEVATEVAPMEQISYEREKKNHPGRQVIPEHLPIEEIIIEPEADTRGMEKIGEAVTETLEYSPASLVKKRIVRPKYVDKKNDRIYIGELPPRPIEKCIAEPSLLSHIIVAKFVDHIPFYRQIQRFKRDYSLELASSTVNDWFIATCTLLEPLYEKLRQQILQSDYIQADESPIKVQDNGKKLRTHQGYQWVYSSPQNGMVLFQYRKGRGMHGPKEMLKDFKGYLQCDGYVVYDKIGTDEKITLVGCMAHLRRKFYEALQSDKIKAEYGLTIIKNIYHHERECKSYEASEKKAYRLEHSKPLMEALKTWVEAQAITVLPKSPLGKAMTYVQRQWPKILAILEDGRLEIDNNLVENKIRPLALGRKNYLFAGSHPAAQRIAMMYSFFATCKNMGVNPYEWLKNTVQQIPETKLSELDSLLPGFGLV